MKRAIAFLAILWAICPSLIAQPQTGQSFRCTVEASTATTAQALGGDCNGVVGLAHYVTDIIASSSAAAGTTADSMMTLEYGTGTTCGTGTTRFWLALQGANTSIVQSFKTPIRIPDGNDMCWIMSTAGTKTLVITGYIAP